MRSLLDTFSAPLCLALAGAILALGGCKSDVPRVVSAELIESDDSGHPYPARAEFTDPLLVLTLDRAAPALLPGSVRLTTSPPVEFEVERLELEGGPDRTLVFRITAGAENLRTAGVFRGAPAAANAPMGLGVDLGDGVQWIDIQPRPSHPELRVVTWEDRDGDLVVSEGDWLRLVFDRDVVLGVNPDSESAVVRVPEDVILTSPADRLDDGDRPAVFLSVDQTKQVIIRLGSEPRLTPVSRLAVVASGGDAPRGSAIALNGTPVQPLEKIVGLKSVLGAISRRERLVRLPGDYPAPVKLEERFTDEGGGTRVLPTVTPFLSGRGAVIAGGLDDPSGNSSGLPLDDVFFFDPLLPAGERLVPIGDLSEARCFHTATRMPGPDHAPGTGDDFIVVAGGMDGKRSLDSIDIVRADGAGFSVERIGQLRSARHHHVATLIPPNAILFSGGVRDDDESRTILGRTELLTFVTDDDGEVRVDSDARLDFDLLPRMRHTGTLLAPTPDGVPLTGRSWRVLFYGGVGQDASELLIRQHVQNLPGNQREGQRVSVQPTVDPSKARILAAPEVIEIDLGSMSVSLDRDAPLASFLEWDFDYALLRYGHEAVLVPPRPGTDDGAARVLITGGSLAPPFPDPEDVLTARMRLKWQLPFTVDGDVLATFGSHVPTGKESASALVVVLGSGDGPDDRIEILPSPTGDARVFHETVLVPGRGVVVVGGEHPETPRQKVATTELYLPHRGGDAGHLAAFPLTLATPRSRFEGCYLRGSLYLFGGVGDEEQSDELAPVEEIRIE